MKISMISIITVAILMNIFSIQLCSGTIRAFWHITDTHSDWLYKIGSAAGLNKLCRTGSGNAGKYGAFDCHAPLSLLEETAK